MLVVGFPAGPWGTNCFVVAPAAGSECLIIDPGKDCGPRLQETVAEHRLHPVAVLLTHGHIDHTWSVVPVADGYGIPAYIHPDDRELLTDPAKGLSPDTVAALAGMTGGLTPVEPADVRVLGDGTALDLAGLSFAVRHAPGHTPGSVTFGTPRGADAPPVLFSGDLLFAGSIGRVDLPGGNLADMLVSLEQVVLPLADDTVVLPGHGPQTTIGAERAGNPYVAEVVAGVDRRDGSRGAATDLPRRGL